MKYIEKFYVKEFKGETAKKAYLKATEFVAKNILGKECKVEVDRVTWNIQRVKGDLPTFRLTLYYTYDDKEFYKSTCEACKEAHCTFFVNENYNCDRCNKAGYLKRVQGKLDIGSKCFKEKLDNELESF